jgi:thiol-disulfide isomerase/thioredoxin
MRSNFQLLLLLCIITITSHAQEAESPPLNIGDPAPRLRVREWLKGEPAQGFEKDNVYVVEFWATWCGPCRAVMPHLAALANEYKDRVTILGIDILEKKTTSMEKIKAFVDSMGHRMDYHVAADDSNFMVTDWLYASGHQGIPTAYVVNQEGRVAWIGYPTRLDEVLPKILNHTWDIKKTFEKRKFDKRLADLDDSAYNKLISFRGDPEMLFNLHKQDSALLMIDEMVRMEPNLKYAPRVGIYTFTSILQTNPQKAYEFGKVLLLTSTYEDPPYYILKSVIEYYSYKLYLPAEIYELAAEAYQGEIDHYPETADIPKDYHKMAEWYWRACNRSKAIEAEQKAIEALKGKEKFSQTDLAAFESQLQQYKSM